MFPSTNVCYNAVDRHVKDGKGDKTAMIFEGNEAGRTATMTYAELQREVCRTANWLKAQGVKKGLLQFVASNVTGALVETVLNAAPNVTVTSTNIVTTDVSAVVYNDADALQSGAQCREGHGGLKCSLCVPVNGTKYARQGQYCAACPSERGQADYSAIYAVLLAILVGFAVYNLYVRPLLQNSDALLKDADMEGNLEESDYGTYYQMFKIIVSFYQVTSTFTQNFNIEWPDLYAEVSRVISFANLNFLQLPGVNCIMDQPSFYRVFELYIVASTCFLVLNFLVARIVTYVYRRLGHGDSINLCAFNDGCVHATLLFCFISYPSLSNVILSIFRCETIEGEDWLSVDLRIRCHTPEHKAYMALGAFGTIAYVIGIPVAYFLLPIMYKVPQMARWKSEDYLILRSLMEAVHLDFLPELPDKWHCQAYSVQRAPLLAAHLVLHDTPANSVVSQMYLLRAKIKVSDGETTQEQEDEDAETPAEEKYLESTDSNSGQRKFQKTRSRRGQRGKKKTAGQTKQKKKVKPFNALSKRMRFAWLRIFKSLLGNAQSMASKVGLDLSGKNEVVMEVMFASEEKMKLWEETYKKARDDDVGGMDRMSASLPSPESLLDASIGFEDAQKYEIFDDALEGDPVEEVTLKQAFGNVSLIEAARHVLWHGEVVKPEVIVRHEKLPPDELLREVILYAKRDERFDEPELLWDPQDEIAATIGLDTRRQLLSDDGNTPESKRRQVLEQRAMRMMGLLFQGYHSNCWWYESFQLVNKLLLTSLVVFIPTGGFSQEAVAMLISFIGLLVAIKISPQDEERTDLLEQTALLSTFLTLFTALLLRLQAFEVETENSQVLGILLLVLALGIPVVPPLLQGYIELRDRSLQRQALQPSKMGDAWWNKIGKAIRAAYMARRKPARVDIESPMSGGDDANDDLLIESYMVYYVKRGRKAMGTTEYMCAAEQTRRAVWATRFRENVKGSKRGEDEVSATPGLRRTLSSRRTDGMAPRRLKKIEGAPVAPAPVER